MALTMTRMFGADWPGPIGGTYIEQGDIFERVAAAAMRGQGWQVYRSGWASGINNPPFSQVVDRVAAELDEKNVNTAMVDQYAESNELGLDLVCHRPFRDDRRGGRPVFLAQCASGMAKNATEAAKAKTPDLEIWCKLISFSANPKRAYFSPHSYGDLKFFKLCNRVDGLVIDRYRLLSAGHQRARWIPRDVRDDIHRVVGASLSRLSAIRA
jgi:hypothetical protein